jgi:hypothetical protein
MGWIMAGVLIILVVAAGGVFVAVDRWLGRELKRQMDRLIFPLYHQNRELRLRNAQLRADLGLGDDEEL